jgi:RNA methyltransferase, TrmH family
MRQITSPDNPVWKQVKKLQRKKGRDSEGCYLIEGFHLVLEALDNGKDLTLTLIRESLLEQEPSVSALITRLEAGGVAVFVTPDDIFDRTADTETPQGLLSVVRRHDWRPIDFFEKNDHNENSNLIVLDRLQDPGNVGTILRTADAAGFMGAIILKGTADIYGPKVVRAASGSLLRIPVLFIDSPEDCIALLRHYGKQSVAATPYGDRNYYECPIAENTAIIIGNEGGGVSETLLEQTDIRLRIPMDSSVESLNASVAAGILIFESIRQKKYPIIGGN